ncbi:hypothetical protein ACGIF2_09935 [Cellulomonas sp. P22]|uniref:hypothetical protein n=1 Tax=Cellulomonas sp. P22 TaxID=3373189 RepID=UPI0037B035D0
MVDQSHAAGQGVLVFRRLDAPAAPEAARLDLSSGLLTPAQTSWRRRPVVIDGKAFAEVRGRKDGVDLVVERANGWRVASAPLLEVTQSSAVTAPPELLDGLADAIDRFGPRGAADAVALLRLQSRYLRHDGGPAQTSPFARRVAGLSERFARLGF